jgi:hypothetical protein
MNRGDLIAVLGGLPLANLADRASGRGGLPPFWTSRLSDVEESASERTSRGDLGSALSPGRAPGPHAG